MSDMISRLGLDIDTGGLARGQAELERLRSKSDQAANSATRLERATGMLHRQMLGLVGAAASLAAVMGVGLGVSAVLKYGEAWTQATNQLRLATESVEQLRVAQEGAFEAAQKTFSSYDATANLASKIQRFAGDVTGGMEQTLALVETINKASAVGGTAAASQAAGLFQLNQALASSVLRGAELNSVLEQLPIVAKAIADGLGKPIGELKKLGEQGVLTSEVVIRAIQNQADEIDKAFQSLEPTVSMASQKIANALTKTIGTAGAPIFEAIATSLSDLADTLASTGAIEAFTGAVNGLLQTLGTLGNILSVVVGLLPAVAAGFAAMMVVKTLAPFFVLLEASMAGSVARAMAMSVAANTLSAAFVTARTSAIGLVTALGGPLGIALGAATALLVGFATQTRQAAIDIRDVGAAAEETANRTRAALARMNDANSEIARAATEEAGQILATASDAIAAAQSKFDAAVAAQESALAERDRVAKARNVPADQVPFADYAIEQVRQAAIELESANRAFRAAWEEIGRLPETAVNNAPITLPPAIDEAAAKKAQKEWEDFLEGIDEVIAKIAEARAARSALMAEANAAAGIADYSVAVGATVEELDRQLDILSDTEQLLSGPLADAYAALGDRARAVAREDATANCIVIGGVLQSDPATGGACSKSALTRAFGDLSDLMRQAAIEAGVDTDAGRTIYVAWLVLRNQLKPSPGDFITGYATTPDVPLDQFNAMRADLRAARDRLLAAAAANAKLKK